MTTMMQAGIFASVLLGLILYQLYGGPAVWQWKMFLNVFVDVGPDANNARRSSSSSSQQQLRVIGAGLPRTGTDSLRTALDRLGHKTYHAQVVHPEGHHPVWKDLFEASLSGNDSSKEFDAVVDAMLDAGYDATTDFPSCLVVVELARKFPEAKVVLSVRDTPETWAESYGTTVGLLFAQSVREPIQTMSAARVGRFAEFMDVRLGNRTVYRPGRRPTRESLARSYKYWIEHVKENIEAERLLVHNAKEGWGPLCEHLEVPSEECPREAYPHVNTKMVWVGMVAIVCFLTDHWPYCMVVPGTGGIVFVLGVARVVRKCILPRIWPNNDAAKSKSL